MAESNSGRPGGKTRRFSRRGRLPLLGSFGICHGPTSNSGRWLGNQPCLGGFILDELSGELFFTGLPGRVELSLISDVSAQTSEILKSVARKRKMFRSVL